MTYSSEPYAQFADDLLTSLTGGVAREQFLFLDATQPFPLSPPGAVVPASLQVFGQAGATFRRFATDRDYSYSPTEKAIVWLARADGTPAADAVWPDLGTTFYVNYDHKGPSGSAAPLLSDRNVGSVTRLLAESLAREFAVLSRQLEGVYNAAFLDTAGTRDLDQLVALVGLERRTRSVASGSVVFSRSSPASADTFIAAGTKLSTSQPPAASFETTEDRTLHRGSLSVEAPVRALVPGSAGVVPANAITVIHRPIFGIESAANAQGTQLGGDDETDAELRLRAKRALEGAGEATLGAIVSALTTLPGVREKDIRIAEDHLRRPGVVTLNLAADLSDANRQEAVSLIEASRPAGVRVLHDLSVPFPIGMLDPAENAVDENEAPADATTSSSPLFYPVRAAAIILPASASLSAADRQTMKRAGEDAIRAFVADAGIGETLVYNGLVADLMALNGVQDVALELYAADTPLTTTRHRNLAPPAALRATVDPKHGGALVVEVGGQLVALDVTIKVTLKAPALGGGTDVGDPTDTPTELEDVRLLVHGQLQSIVQSLGAFSAAQLRAKIVPGDLYSVDALSFTVEFVAAGVRVNKVFTEADATAISIAPEQRPWVRMVSLDPASA